MFCDANSAMQRIFPIFPPNVAGVWKWPPVCNSFIITRNEGTLHTDLQQKTVKRKVNLLERNIYSLYPIFI
jgi:hypothetical protein